MFVVVTSSVSAQSRGVSQWSELPANISYKGRRRDYCVLTVPEISVCEDDYFSTEDCFVPYGSELSGLDLFYN